MSGQLFTAHHTVLAAGTKVILFLVLAPVLAGLVGVVLPATGWFPPLGGDTVSLSPVRAFLAEPGLVTSLSLSIFTALMATALSYVLAMGLLAVLVGTGGAALLTRLISPLLSVPHITIAVGFLFLLQPSGWLIRLLSPWATGLERPPNLNLVPDEAGWMLVIGLVAKELPFLVLMGLSAASQIDARRLLDGARSLGRPSDQLVSGGATPAGPPSFPAGDDCAGVFRLCCRYGCCAGPLHTGSASSAYSGLVP